MSETRKKKKERKNEREKISTYVQRNEMGNIGKGVDRNWAHASAKRRKKDTRYSKLISIHTLLANEEIPTGKKHKRKIQDEEGIERVMTESPMDLG